MIDQDIVIAIICSTLVILLLIAVIVIVFFASGRQRLRQQKEMAESKLTFQEELRKVETEVSEHMLNQFAKELHDNIGQLLTAMHIQIENQKIDNPGLIEGFKPLEIYLGEVTQQLRLLSRTLNNDYIEHIGLISVIQIEVDRLKALRRFKVHWNRAEGTSNLNKDQELMVFRVFQEITQNALRHSSAKNFYVSINNKKNTFTLTVKDDGKGFNLKEILKSDKASGLRNIMKRVELGGLVCDITSSLGEGSLFTIKKGGILD